VTAWGVVAVCGIGGLAAGPVIDVLARRVRRPAPAVERSAAPSLELAMGADAPASPATPHLEGVTAAPCPPGGTSPATTRRVAVLEGGAVAVLTATACALAAVRLGEVPQLAAYCVLAGALAAVSVTDLRTGLVPRRIVYAAVGIVGAALLAACAADGTWRPALDALLGGAAGFLVLGAVWWVSPKAMGFGDVRLAGLCGGALGWLGLAPVYLGFLAAFVAGTLMGVVVLLTRGRRRFPFAPALAVGTMFGVLWGTWLGDLWLHVR
jgi:leader peptidase (prepilin peptidase) / N-methyltransferase